MANFDAIELNLGIGGKNLATDEIASKQILVQKLVTGDRGFAEYVTDANPYPIKPGTGVTFTIVDGGSSITVDGSVSITGAVTVQDGGSSVTVDGLVTVQDGGSSITVDGLVDAAQSGTWTVQPGNTPNTVPWLMSIHDGTTKATVRELGTNDALNVAIVDGSGNQITSFGGGTQYTEGDVDASVTGSVAMWEDTGDTIRATSVAKPLPTQISDGTRTATVRDTGSSDSLNVAIVDASGNQITSFGGGTQYTEGDVDASITGGAVMWEDAGNTLAAVSVTKGLPVQPATGASFTVNDGGSAITVDGTVGATQNGTWNITNVSGTVSLPTGAATAAKQPNFGTAGSPSADVITVQGVVSMTALKVDGSAVTQPVSGTVSANVLSVIPGTTATSLGKAEDAAHSTGDVGVMSLAVRSNNAGTAFSDTVGDYTPLTVDDSGRLRTDATLPNGLLDSFGHLVSGSINNQVDIQFYRSNGAVSDLVTETNLNGGTATATGGMATFACTTTANSQAKGVSPNTTIYTAGAEIYCIFTAAFTGTGSGTSYQRIGLYDDNNGFFIGYSGNTFGANIRKGGSTTTTVKSSWNIDTLVGGAGSKFTRNGTPESVDLTKLNVWRIRFGWVGSAPVKFEILSPDGVWVTFHEIKQPNLAAVPSIENADLPVTCDVNGGNSSAALSILSNCWCAGTTAAMSQLNADLNTANYAQLVRSVITGWSTAGGGSFENVKVNPSGALTVASSQDGIWTQRLQDGSGNAITSAARGAERALSTQIVDGSGAQITAFTNTQYAEGATAVTITGIAGLMEGAANTLVPLQGTSADGLLVNLGTNNDVTVTGTVAATQSGTWNVTNISGTVSLPTGAATAAKQPNFGTAGSPSADVLTVQGTASMTALKVDGSAVTQPVSGTVSAAQSGTWTVTGSGGTFPVTDSGGSLTVDAPVGTPAFVRLSDGAAPITTLPVSLSSVPSHDVTNAGTFAVQAAQSGTWTQRLQDGSGNAITSASRGSERALTVQIVDGSGGQITTFGGGTQYTEGDVDASITGNVILLEGAGNTVVPAQGTVADGLLVNLGANNDVTVTGTVAATQSGTWNVTNVSGTVSLPTGASTLAEQQTQTTALQLLDNAVVTNGGAAPAAAYAIAGTDGLSSRIISVDSLGNIAFNLNYYNGTAAGAANALHVRPGTAAVFNVADNSSSLTVDAPVGTPVNVQIGDGTRTATVRDTGSSDSLNVAIVDGSGNQITSFGGGTQYTEGDTDASITGNVLLVEGAGDTLVPAQGTVADGLLVNLGANNDVTVTGTVAVTQSGTWSQRLQDGSGNNITSAARGSERALSVQIVDGSGNQVATFGGGTQYTEADVDSSITGTAVMWEDTGDTLRAASVAKPLPTQISDGSNTATIRNLASNDALNVAIVDGSGNHVTSFGGGTQYAEGDTAATITGTAVLWEDTSNTLRPVNASKPLPVSLSVNADDPGLTPYKLISAATTNATSVKASAGRIQWLFVSNTNGSTRWLKLYNKSSAPTVGTDTPVLTLLIPGGASAFNISPPKPIAFSSGIAFALTTGVADADTAAVGANEIVVNMGYV